MRPSSLEHFRARGTTLGLEAVTNRFSGTIPTQVGKLHSVMNFMVNECMEPFDPHTAFEALSGDV